MNFKDFYLKENSDNDLSVGIVLFNGDKVLILKRGDSAPWMPSKWSLPGGMVEDGEDLIVAVERELYEETKIKADNVKFMKTYNNWHVFTGNTDYKQTDLEMENKQHDWILFDNINDYDYVPDALQSIRDAFKLKP